MGRDCAACVRVEHTQITNISGTSQHLHVMAPTTPFFRLEYANKKGLVPPGLSEEVKLFFAPTEYRYYYDCIRVRCEKQESMMIPIHAYPAINDFHFPARYGAGVTPIPEPTLQFARQLPRALPAACAATATRSVQSTVCNGS